MVSLYPAYPIPAYTPYPAMNPSAEMAGLTSINMIPSYGQNQLTPPVGMPVLPNLQAAMPNPSFQAPPPVPAIISALPKVDIVLPNPKSTPSQATSPKGNQKSDVFRQYFPFAITKTGFAFLTTILNSKMAGANPLRILAAEAGIITTETILASVLDKKGQNLLHKVSSPSPLSPSARHEADSGKSSPLLPWINSVVTGLGAVAITAISVKGGKVPPTRSKYLKILAVNGGLGVLEGYVTHLLENKLHKKTPLSQQA